MKGDIEFADAETYPFADTVHRFYKGGFLNAVSVGWLPLEWSASKDRTRPGGIDFTKAELLEVSCVPVPSLPTALAEARARGIITRSELRAFRAKAPPAARRFEHLSDRRRHARQLADELLGRQVDAALARMPNGGRGTRLDALAGEWCSVTAKLCLTGRRTAMYDDLEAEQSRLGGHLRRLIGGCPE